LEREAGLRKLGTDSGRARVKKPLPLARLLSFPLASRKIAECEVQGNCGMRIAEFGFEE
jgi:hypothetical protein